ncbi:MAG: 3-dehydroquinate synthase [Flavobacteriales bacterium]|nr:3-dehydroquinate synthase [Flavobacteriales bacterium]
MDFQANLSPVFFEDQSLSTWNFWIHDRKLNRLFILVDENTYTHCLPIVKQVTSSEITIHEIIVPAGETSKSLEFANYIWKQLIALNATRSDCLVNLGGGMITDLGGFAASLYKRGMRFVHFPTTLLAQVDASIGGKTGVDFEYIKNMLGTWSQPDAIFIYSDFLNTLDERQIKNGWAEMLKHALISSSNYWQEVKQFDLKNISHFIRRSVEIKMDVVSQDPFENNLRKVLNFGHTVGHALEAFFMKKSPDMVCHGEAIAAGMICEALIATRCCGLPMDVYYEIENVLDEIYVRLSFSETAIPEILEYMMQDKKNNQSEIRMALIASIGKALPEVPVKKDLIAHSLQMYLKG